MIWIEARELCRVGGVIPALERLDWGRPDPFVVIHIKDAGDQPIDAAAVTYLRRLPRLVVGWIAGDCIGPAWDLARACDLCVAEAGARYGSDTETAIVAAPGPVVSAVGTPDELRAVLAQWEEAAGSRAVRMLASLLRRELYRDVDLGLYAESLVYSTLQGGVEFQAWLRSR